MKKKMNLVVLSKAELKQVSGAATRLGGFRLPTGPILVDKAGYCQCGCAAEEPDGEANWSKDD